MSDNEIRMPDLTFADRLINDDKSYYNYSYDDEIAHDLLDREDTEFQNFIFADIKKNNRIMELSEICKNLVDTALPRIKRLAVMDKSNKYIYNNMLYIIEYLYNENHILHKNYKKHLQNYINLMKSNDSIRLVESINNLIDIIQ